MTRLVLSTEMDLMVPVSSSKVRSDTGPILPAVPLVFTTSLSFKSDDFCKIPHLQFSCLYTIMQKSHLRDTTPQGVKGCNLT